MTDKLINALAVLDKATPGKWSHDRDAFDGEMNVNAEGIGWLFSLETAAENPEENTAAIVLSVNMARAAIEYAQKTGHSEDCNKIYEQAGGPSSDDPEYKCTCGYDALMAALPEGSDKP